MNIFEAIFLGILQGLTEFLPISSTGHLTLAGKFMNLISTDEPYRWTSFIAVMQLGTMLAVILYFWKDIISIVKAFFAENVSVRKKFNNQSLNSRLGWYIIIGTIPVVLAGLGLKHFIEGTFTKNLYVISFSLIILGVLLGVADKKGTYKKDITKIKWLDSLIIGIAQAFALIPGASRSGTTLTAGIFLGLDRETAARFSFLLSIPAVLASGLLELKQSLDYINFSDSINLFTATLTAAVVGYLTIEFLLRYLKKKTTFIFVYYRIILGVMILAIIFCNIIKP
jgi:undecaprenyl-diphosphatase